MTQLSLLPWDDECDVTLELTATEFLIALSVMEKADRTLRPKVAAKAWHALMHKLYQANESSE
jgi:hypothetical protein